VGIQNLVSRQQIFARKFAGGVLKLAKIVTQNTVNNAPRSAESVLIYAVLVKESDSINSSSSFVSSQPFRAMLIP
jgi:hypothetical protein